MKTLEQLKKDYIETTTSIIDLGEIDVLKELQSQLKIKETPQNQHPVRNIRMYQELKNKVHKLSKESAITSKTLEQFNEQIYDDSERLDKIDKKLEDQEKYLEGINCEQIDINNKLEHHEIGINQLFDKYTSLANNEENGINQLFDKYRWIDERFDRMDESFNRVVELEKKLDNLNSDQVKIDDRLLNHIQSNPPLESVVDNLNIEKVDMNKRLKHVEEHLTKGENNTVKFTSYEGLQELIKIKAEFDNLKNKSNNERGK